MLCDTPNWFISYFNWFYIQMFYPSLLHHVAQNTFLPTNHKQILDIVSPSFAIQGKTSFRNHLLSKVSLRNSSTQPQPPKVPISPDPQMFQLSVPMGDHCFLKGLVVFSHPSEKRYAWSNWITFPKFRDENKTYFRNHKPIVGHQTIQKFQVTYFHPRKSDPH